MQQQTIAVRVAEKLAPEMEERVRARLAEARAPAARARQPVASSSEKSPADASAVEEARDVVAELGAAPSAAAARRPAELTRKYSVASQHAVDTLEGLDMQLKNMQLDLDRSADAIGAPPGTGLDPKLRNDLAQLHGNLNKLLATKLDAILTGDLNSGKDDARAKRKELIRKVRASRLAH